MYTWCLKLMVSLCNGYRLIHCFLVKDGLVSIVTGFLVNISVICDYLAKVGLTAASR